MQAYGEWQAIFMEVGLILLYLQFLLHRKRKITADTFVKPLLEHKK